MLTGLPSPQMAIQDSPSDREKSQSPQSDLDDSILRKDYKSQMNRLGYHFREHVVQIVMQDLRITNIYSTFIGETIKKSVDGKLIPEPLPPTQQLIYQQADAVIRDLFPRIPNTDRGEVLEHAFNMVNFPPLSNSTHYFIHSFCLNLSVNCQSH